ncbi:hypothetical protein EVAR_53565_1 [Eumeta japonica]|uniref:Uncharacterized protein n=1 Tax=Eumeta variegata TaxID=151549 RepID=A0A4C1YPN3_EUMVA|nr:hypothetical protein EVAR_53565_1 [Eumeta japonica]
MIDDGNEIKSCTGSRIGNRTGTETENGTAAEIERGTGSFTRTAFVEGLDNARSPEPTVKSIVGVGYPRARSRLHKSILT